MHEEMGSQIVVSDVAGDVIRLQPNHINFKTVDAIEDIHGSRTKARKGEFYENVVRPPGKPADVINATYVVSQIVLLNPETRTSMHSCAKGINPVLRPQALLDLESTIQERLFEFVQ